MLSAYLDKWNAVGPVNEFAVDEPEGENMS